MAHIHSNALIGASGAAGAGDDAYVIPKSLRFNSGDSTSLSRTIPDITTFSFSFWYKHVATTRNDIFVTDSSYGFFFYQHTDGSFRLNNNNVNLFVSNGLYRDPSAWYHLLLTNDGTTLKFYVNGVLDKAQTVGTYLNAGGIYIGRDRASANNYGDFLLADAQFVDGQALTPTDFGETRSSDGVWVPKEYTGSYGPAIDQSQTWSSAAADSYGFDGSTAYNSAATRMYGTSTYHKIVDADNPFTNVTSVVVGTSENVGNIKLDGTVYTTSYASGVGLTVTSPPSSFSDIEVLGASNGVQIAYVKISGVLLVDSGVTISHNGFHLNFGDSSTNEALGFDSAPTIPDADPKKGFDVVTYTGNGASTPGGSGNTQNVGGLAFEPGLLWIKDRTQSGHNHNLIDVINQPPNLLMSDATNALVTNSTDGVTSINPDGFSLGANSSGTQSLEMNKNGNNYVAWAWKASGAAVSNTSGTITSQVSASTEYGFSVVKYTGTGSNATVGHSLGKAPAWILVKTLDDAYNWFVYHKGVDASAEDYYLRLNTTGTRVDSSAAWNDTAPTSTLFSIGTDGSVNESGDDYIAYCWSEISGYSKFSSFSGSGAAGNKQTLGFKPRWVLIKCTTTDANEWVIFDTERNPTNPADDYLYANSSSAEGSYSNRKIEVLDDGFQFYGSDQAVNTSGDTYIYAAFADRPGNNWDVNNLVTNEGLSTSKSQFDIVTYTGNGNTTQQIGGPVYSAQTLSAVDSSQTVTNAGNAFNGDLTTSSYTTGGTRFTPIGGSQSNVTSLRFYSKSFGQGGTIKLNGTTIESNYDFGQGGWYSFSSTALSNISNTLTSFEWDRQPGSGSNNYDYIYAVEINGTVLLDGTGIGLKFQPDFVWLKNRSSAYSHTLYDSIRGVGINKALASNTNGTQGSLSDGTTFGYVNSLNSDGFTVTKGSDGTSYTNGNNQNYVAYCWKASGTAVSNTAGSITSSVSANAAYGFSIVSYTGTGSAATVGHGLNKVPQLIIIKSKDSANEWAVYSSPVGPLQKLQLNESSTATDTNHFNDVSPTSTVFSIGATQSANKSGDSFIAYCFANVPGYQRIGSYYSNSSDPIVITGFKPRFLLVKKYNGAGNWMLLDSQRSLDDNDIRTTFEVNNHNAEETHANRQVKFLDNGFQLIGADMDTSNSNWLYWAIGDDEIGSDEDCLVDVPNAVTADADATDTTGGYQRGNYATLNPLNKHNSNNSLTNGNLEFTTSGNDGCLLESTIAMSSGKFYFEVVYSRSGTGQLAGIRKPGARNYNDSYIYVGTGNKYTNGGSSVSYGATLAHGDVIGTAFDADNGTLTFYKNGVSQGQAFSGISGTYSFLVGSFGTAPTGIVNFGQMRFKYPMPSGYAALNTTALPAATIPDGSAHFDVKTYTANANVRSITGYEFAPDFLWFKPRVAGSHNLYDTVRGATKGLRSQSTNSEYTDAQTLTSFNSDGFSLGTDSGGYQVNYSNNPMVVWAWNAGSSTVSNTDGSITSSIRANPSAGFSIVTYTGTGSAGTVGHGLNAAPEMIILKGRNFADNWRVYHEYLDSTEPEDYYMMLESLNQRSADQNASFMNDTAPTSSVFSLGTDSAINGSSRTMVAYCFTSVSGYSKIGSFEGNGSADGPFVYLGFRPAFLLVRLIEGANSSWKLYDNARDPDNPIVNQLYANSTNGEPSDDVRCDFLSNGFKVRTAGSEDNYNNNTLIYYAVAENPFQANGGLAR